MKRGSELRVLAEAAISLANAIDASRLASERRMALGTDCTRARMTTANARWMRAAEDRDRKQVEFEAALARCTGEGA